jgi:hypothetical protein
MVYTTPTYLVRYQAVLVTGVKLSMLVNAKPVIGPGVGAGVGIEDGEAVGPRVG